MSSCNQYIKDTNLKAIHNRHILSDFKRYVVINISKILI